MEPNESFPTSQTYAVESSKKDHSTVLVTGCSGFIGSHLVERFILTDENCRFEVRCMTRNVNSVERVFNGG
ncbi:MAG: NAD-dependent epimerase/dehydratase family protein, partial [Nitrososphaeraceae archaeon]